MDGNSEQLQVINLKQLPIIEERLRDVKAKIEQRTSAVMALAVTEETRTDVKKIRTEVRKELEGYEAQRMAVKKAIMTPYEQFEAVYKECVSNPYKAADEALGKKIADVEVGIKQQKEDDVRAFFTELTSGFGLDWLKFEQMNLKVTLTCTPKAMKTAITTGIMDAASCFAPARSCSSVTSSWKPSAALPKNAAPASRLSRRPKPRPRQPLRLRPPRGRWSSPLRRTRSLHPRRRKAPHRPRQPPRRPLPPAPRRNILRSLL